MARSTLHNISRRHIVDTREHPREFVRIICLEVDQRRKIDMEVEERLAVIVMAADVAKDRWFLHPSSLQGGGGQEID